MIDVGPNEKSRVAIVVGRVDCNDPPALFFIENFLIFLLTTTW